MVCYLGKGIQITFSKTLQPSMGDSGWDTRISLKLTHPSYCTSFNLVQWGIRLKWFTKRFMKAN